MSTTHPVSARKSAENAVRAPHLLLSRKETFIAIQPSESEGLETLGGRAAGRLGGERSLLQKRLDSLLAVPVDYIFNADFDAANSETEILGVVPAAVTKSTPRVPAGLPAYLASLYAVPLLTHAQEVYYFRKMNYLKYRAVQLRESISVDRPNSRVMTKVEDLLRQAAEAKNTLVQTNLRLVVSVARKCARPGSDFFEVVSDGNISLMRAVDKFDYGRGFKFSTYATWAIRRNFARSIPAEYTQLGRFRTGNDELFQASKDGRGSEFAEERTNRMQHAAIEKIMNELQERERDIISLRFGLSASHETLTLEQVGHRFGVSKERIRQLEARALRKLREIATSQKLDVGV